jgi:hypothetical protein
VKKLLLGGIWVCAVTSASVYFASWNAGGASVASEEALLQGIDYVKTRQITVPRISEGRIQGYVIARFVFTVDAQTARDLAVPPEIFVVDEAFRTIYGDDKLDFDHLEKVDLPGLTARITTNVNERLQPDLIKEILVEQFDYVPYDSLISPAVSPADHAVRMEGTLGSHAEK